MIQKRPSFDVTELVTKKYFMTFHGHFILHGYKRKDNKTQIIFDVSINKKRARIPTGLYVDEQHWDIEKNRVKPKYDFEDINLTLDNMEAKSTDIRTHYRLSRTPLSVEKFKESLCSKTPTYDFISFMNYMIEKLPIKDGTRRHAKSVAKKLGEYKNPIAFHDLTIDFFDEYRGHLFGKGNKQTTINSNIKTIKKYIGQAIKKGIYVNLDIEDLKVGSMKGSVVNLDLQEVKKLKEYYFSTHINESYKLILGYFLFSCFTSLRLNEVMGLRRNDLLGSTVTYPSTKTNKVHTVVLNKTSKKIVEENDLLFVKFPKEQVLNRTLKTIMNAVGIRKRVSMHVGRHTFATNFLRKGGTVQNLQHILNHSSITTTMLYVHIVEKEANVSIHLLDD